MNRIYRLIWSEVTNSWIPAPEFARGRGKRAQVVSAAAMLLTVAGQSVAAPVATELPTGGQVSAGAASIQQSAAVMNINQTTQRASINWQTFNIGTDATVNFNQPSASSVTLNRVLDSNPSQIFGQINANGQVYLTNSSGIYFAPSASVNVGGLVATTHSISDTDFMAGKDRFIRNGASGSVINEGELTASLGGYIALLAPEVRNQGVIIAQLGTIALAAGEAYTLQFTDDHLTGIQVEPAAIQALVENGQAIAAPGGLIILSALAADSLQGSVVNTGSLAANSLTNKGGVIRLEGDDITLASGSTIDASGATGGGTVLVGGDWQGSGELHQATTVTMEQGAGINASASQNGDGGKVVLWSDIADADSLTQVAGDIKATGAGAGTGGKVETSGYQLGVSSTVDAGQGGEWLLDPIDLTISSSGTTSVPDTGGITAPTSTTTILNTSINTALDNGNSITLKTNGGTGGSGNITVSADITKTSGTASSLTLQANGNIVVSSGVTISDSSSANALSLNLQASGPIRFADNSTTTNSVNIHGDLYLGGFAGGTSYASGDSTYRDGIYIGKNTALTAASMTMFGQGAGAITNVVGGTGVTLGSAASLTATGTVDVTAIGGAGLAGSNGTDGSKGFENTDGTIHTNGFDGGAGTNGGSGVAGGNGIGLAAGVNIAADTIKLTGSGGDGGNGGNGGNGGDGGDTGTSVFGTRTSGNGGNGGKGGSGAAGGLGITLGTSSLLSGSNITLTGAGGASGAGGTGGSGGNGGTTGGINDTAGNGGNGSNGGNGAHGSVGLVLANGVTISSTAGSIAVSATDGAEGSRGTRGTKGLAGICTKACTNGTDGSFGSYGIAGTQAIAFTASGAGYIGAANGGSSSADITFINDSMDPGSLVIASTGVLGIETKTASTVIDLGNFASDSTHLQLTQTAFWNGSSGNFRDGFSSINVGSVTQSGNIRIGDISFYDPLTLQTSGNVVVNNGAVTTNNQSLTVIAGGYIQNDFDIVAGSGAIDITADTVAFNSNTGSNPLQTTGTLTLRTNTTSTAMSLASANAYNGGTGFDLNATEISYLKNSAASSITIGRSDGSGAMTFAGTVDLSGHTVTLLGNGITLNSGASLNTGSSNATLTTLGGNFINNSGSGTPISAGQWWLYSADPALNTLGGISANKHYAQTYSAGSVPTYASSGNWLLYSISPVLSVAPGAKSITYGDTTGAFTPTYSGFIDGDTGATAGISGTALYSIGGTTSTSGNYNAGTHEVTYVSGLASSLGYTFADEATSTAELTVTVRSLNVSANGQNKVYDTTTAATVSMQDDRVSADVLNYSYDALFADKNVADNKSVTVSNIVLSGTDAANYTLVNTSTGTTANITAKALTVTGLSVLDKVYDGTVAASLSGTAAVTGLAGDNVSLLSIDGVAFVDKHVGSNKAITITGFTLTGSDAGNYTVGGTTATVNISPAAITLSTSNVVKTYDGTRYANGVATVTSGELFSGDKLSGGSYAYTDEMVGSGNKTVAAQGITINDGNGGANYTVRYVDNTTSTINPATPVIPVPSVPEVLLSTDLSDSPSVEDTGLSWDPASPGNTTPDSQPNGYTNTNEAGAGGSDLNDNSISGVLGNQGNDKDVGNAGGDRSAKRDSEVPVVVIDTTGSDDDNKSGMQISDDNGNSNGQQNTNEAGAGNSDNNDNTVSGELGNQGNDKDVGNAGGDKSKDKGKSDNESKSTDKDKPENDGKSTDKNKSEEDGKSTDKNKSEDDGKSTDKDKPEDDGKSTDKDKPEDDGKSTDKDKPEDDGTSIDKNKSEDDGKSTDKNKSEEDGKSTDKNKSENDGKSTDKNKSEEDGKSADKDKSEDNGKPKNDEQSETGKGISKAEREELTEFMTKLLDADGHLIEGGSGDTAVATVRLDANGRLIASDSGDATVATREGISITLVREPSAEVLGVLTVSLPSETATAGSGFSFPLPEQITSKVGNNNAATVHVTLLSGEPMPAWLHYIAETRTFVAASVPDGAFPVQLLLTIGTQRVALVISERSGN